MLYNIRITVGVQQWYVHQNGGRSDDRTNAQQFTYEQSVERSNIVRDWYDDENVRVDVLPVA